MDVLAGKQSTLAQQITKKNEKKKPITKNLPIFSSFCNTVIDYLNPDEQAIISEEYFTPEIISVLKDKELVECVNAFLKNNLNISETSRNAFLHRNTLLYRVDKIMKITGLNVRNFEDAMSFKLLTIVYEKISTRLGIK